MHIRRMPHGNVAMSMGLMYGYEIKNGHNCSLSTFSLRALYCNSVQINGLFITIAPHNAAVVSFVYFRLFIFKQTLLRMVMQPTFHLFIRMAECYGKI